MILLLLACLGEAVRGSADGADPAVPLDPSGGPDASPFESCAAYVATPDVFGYCLTRRVGTVRSAAAMAEICVRVPAWEGACRQAWVGEQRQTGRETDADVLLAACGSDADCAFEQLDAAPRGDVVAQVDHCETHAPPYFSDCTGHALTRWVEGTPTVGEAERLRVRLARHPEMIGRFLALAGSCHGAVDIRCGDGADGVSASCRVVEAQLASRAEKCRH